MGCSVLRRTRKRNNLLLLLLLLRLLRWRLCVGQRVKLLWLLWRLLDVKARTAAAHAGRNAVLHLRAGVNVVHGLLLELL